MRERVPELHRHDLEIHEQDEQTHKCVCNVNEILPQCESIFWAEFIVRACNSFDGLLAACKRQVANIEKWLETGVPAWPEESESIYNQMVEAIANAEGKQQCKK
jgi:hypothetical protein